jgi:hypothetical protein
LCRTISVAYPYKLTMCLCSSDCRIPTSFLKTAVLSVEACSNCNFDTVLIASGPLTSPPSRPLALAKYTLPNLPLPMALPTLKSCRSKRPCVSSFVPASTSHFAPDGHFAAPSLATYFVAAAPPILCWLSQSTGESGRLLNRGLGDLKAPVRSDPKGFRCTRSGLPSVELNDGLSLGEAMISITHVTSPEKTSAYLYWYSVLLHTRQTK